MEELVPSIINIPDHPIRHTRWYQIYVRLARPTLDWATIGIMIWTTILQPLLTNEFDIVAAGMSYTWAAAVYGIKTYEKTKGVA
jgi:hypothetical protein